MPLPSARPAIIFPATEPFWTESDHAVWCDRDASVCKLVVQSRHMTVRLQISSCIGLHPPKVMTYPGCRPIWGPSCASLVAIESCLWQKKRF